MIGGHFPRRQHRGRDRLRTGGSARRSPPITRASPFAKLEFEEKTAKLIAADEVKVAAFNLFRRYRDHMLNIPDRLAAILAAEVDAAKCYEILTSEIRKALNEFADANG